MKQGRLFQKEKISFGIEAKTQIEIEGSKDDLKLMWSLSLTYWSYLVQNYVSKETKESMLVIAVLREGVMKHGQEEPSLALVRVSRLNYGWVNYCFRSRCFINIKGKTQCLSSFVLLEKSTSVLCWRQNVSTSVLCESTKGCWEKAPKRARELYERGDKEECRVYHLCVS